MTDWTTVATLFVIAVTLWAFAGDALRGLIGRLGVSREHVIAIGAGARQVARLIRDALAWFGYRVIVGRPVPIVSSQPGGSAPDLAVAPPVAWADQSATTPVAEPSTPDNEALSVDAFSDLDNKVALAVARLIVESERKPFASGKVSEARAIEVVWRCTRSSREGSTYQDARALLQIHLAALRGEPEFYDDMIKRIEKEVLAQ